MSAQARKDFRGTFLDLVNVHDLSMGESDDDNWNMLIAGIQEYRLLQKKLAQVKTMIERASEIAKARD